MFKNNSNSKKSLEDRIAKWIMPDEEVKESVYEKLKAHRYKILVVTNHRAILFESGLCGKLEDKSDKLWRQLISVHLKQGIRYSALKIYFFQHHDANLFHNPYQAQEPFKAPHWQLKGLDKEQAGRVYTYIKRKERTWKEKRREEHAELLKMPGRPGGMPPPRMG